MFYLFLIVQNTAGKKLISAPIKKDLFELYIDFHRYEELHNFYFLRLFLLYLHDFRFLQMYNNQPAIPVP